MIIVDNVYKRYRTSHGMGPYVLEGASFVIPKNTNVGLIGRNGTGKSTLLRLIAGIDTPSRGRVERHCRVSWPMGFKGGLQSALTGRQNSKFICRIHGHEEDLEERLAFVQDFAEIGAFFDEPVKTYSSGMMARLQFGLSLAFDFDVYISDELTGVGDAAFRKKTNEAFKQLADRAGLIMVSHSVPTLKSFCSAGIWLHEGKAHWFEQIDDAVAAYNESVGIKEESKVKPKSTQKTPQPKAMEERQPKNKSPVLSDELRQILESGMAGEPLTIDAEQARLLVRAAKNIGVELVARRQITKRGYRLKKDEKPVVKKYLPPPADRYVALFDLKTQCLKVGAPSND